MPIIPSEQKEINLNFFTLSFPAALEKPFLDDYSEKSLKHARVALLVAIFFYGFFGLLDALLVPEVKERLWAIRYGIFIPFTFGVFLFSFSGGFKRYMQLSISAVVMVAGLGIIKMILIAPHPGGYFYYAGLILVLFFGYTFFKLRFIYATLTGWMIVVAYEVAAIWWSQTPLPILINNNFFFLGSNVLGMFACYSIEFYLRKDFMQARLLEVEQRKVKAANRELEKRVEDRTAQLVNANKDLKQEIEERKQAEEAARESEQRFRILSENSPEIIYTLGYDGSFTYVNPAWEKVLGYKAAEVIGKYFVDFAANGDAKRYVRLFKRIRDTKATLTDVTGTLLHKDGSIRLFSLSGAPNLDGEGKVSGMVGLLKDITEQQKLETQLRQAQKMEAMGTLAGGVAHDFNNILSAIMGYSELAILGAPEDGKVKQKLREVLRACQRAKELVKQILAFSRQAEEVLKPVEIRLVVKEALKLLRASLPSTIEICQEIDSDTGAIEADPTQIHQLLMNLCTNAAAAMREQGGLLKVGLKNVTVMNPRKSLYMDIEPGSYLELTVCDTGCGMVPEVLEKIFDPYFTTKEKGEGTGLGLSVVHGIVKRHRGGVTVETVPGRGTTFRVYFPKIDMQTPLAKKDGVELLPKGDERILLVDDEEDLVEIGSQMLSNLGYEVIAVSNSEKVVDLFRSQPDRFDLVLTDMTMPKLTGDKLAKELIAIRADIPVVLFTGFSERIGREDALNMGIREYVLKPFTMSDLAKIVRRVLDEKREESHPSLFQ